MRTMRVRTMSSRFISGICVARSMLPSPPTPLRQSAVSDTDYWAEGDPVPLSRHCPAPASKGFSAPSQRRPCTVCGMTEAAKSTAGETQRALSKVPAVTVWFWIIKILCTTVGESFADWVNVTIGVGLHKTALIFTLALAAVMAWQLRRNRYVPLVYWLTVVVFSVTGTLYTDVLTDDLGVPLAVSTSMFA